MQGVCIVTVWDDGSVGFHITEDMPTAQTAVAQPTIQNGTSYLFPLDVTTVSGIARTIKPISSTV